MNDWIYEKYTIGLSKSKRLATMATALYLLSERDGKTLVETGTIRFPDDWGAGMSTLIFGEYAKRNNAHLYTVDINPNAIETCKKVTEEFKDNVSYIISDSIEFLKNFNQKIDLLYLDSMDCPEHDASDSPALITSQTHQLNEMKLAIEKLSDNPIVLLDDNEFINGGKTKLTKKFLKENGFKEILGGKQSLWVK